MAGIIIAFATVAVPFILSAQVGVGASVNANVGATICTMDAKLCPDGSYVGRTGPNCQFVCPGPDATPSDVGSTEDGGYIDIEGSVESESSSDVGYYQEAPHPGIPIGNWFLRIIKNFSGSGSSGTVVDEEASVSADGAVSAEESGIEIQAAEETDVAVSNNWFGLIVSQLRHWFNFGWRDRNASESDVRFSAEPRRGVSPLDVTFSVRTEGSEPRDFALDFGDGSSVSIPSESAMCSLAPEGFSFCTYSAEHTYTTRGAYTAVLSEIIDHCGGNPECLAPVEIKQVGKVQIRVSGDDSNNTATFSAQPTSGKAPLAVTFRSALREPARYSINFGDGTSGTYTICAESYPYQCSTSHTYRSPGTYTAQLIESLCPPNAEGCLAPDRVVKSITVRVTSDGTQIGTALTAVPTSGQAPLRVAFTATVRDSAGQFYVNFGDGRGDGTLTQCNLSYPMKCSVEHTYVQPGTYTASLVQSLCPRNAEGCLAPDIILGSVVITVH